MHVLNINVGRLCSKETVRYNGPAKNQHGTYTMILIPQSVYSGFEGSSDGDQRQVHVHMTLEALIQLEQRIAAAKQHMISH